MTPAEEARRPEPGHESILVVGGTRFERLLPHIRQAGLGAILITYAHGPDLGADVVHRVLDEMSPLAIAEMARRHAAKGVICRTGAFDERAMVRDALVKDLLQSGSDPIRVVTHSTSTAALIVDKGYTRQFLSAHGLPQPDGCVVTGLRDLQDASRDFHFPCVLKNPTSAASRAVKYVRRREDLQDSYRELSVDRVVLQEFVQGIELGLEVVGDGAEYQLFPAAQLGETSPELLPHRRVRMSPLIAEHDIEQRVLDLALTVARLLKPDGVLQLDMVLSGRDPQILEINGRPGGVTSLSHAVTGVDPMGELVRLAIGAWSPADLRAERVAAEIPIRATEVKLFIDGWAANELVWDVRPAEGEYLVTIAAPDLGALGSAVRQIPPEVALFDDLPAMFRE
jgi:biotin carboxylase